MPALYRRYRPETFQEVIGQAHVTEPLQHALVSGRSHHAYLFSGPRGCGKTTSARILARCLNCAEGPTDTPCGVCPSCVELARDGGGSLDVVEIDAASHNGVDDARELRERAVFAPARDRYKIFILDEAHMVTQQGFNALLKIVEEPPEHVKFIFATTEPEKVLTTIRSRTHHYPFRLVPPAELLGYLESVATSEGIEVEAGVLALVVRSGGGSVRDSLSLLDQLIAGSAENTVSLASAQMLLGYTPSAILDEVMAGLHSRDSHATFHVLDRLLHTGQDPRRFVEDLLAHIRDVIVIQATGGDSRDLFPGVSEEDIARWREQTTWFSSSQLSDMAHIVSEELSKLSGVTSPRLHLELLMAQLLSIQGVEAGVPSSSPPPTGETIANAAEPRPAEKPQKKAQTLGVENQSEQSEEAELEAVEPLSPWNTSVLQDVWPSIIEDLSDRKRSLWVALSSTKPLGLEADVLTIGFSNKSDAEILKKPQGPGSPLPNADLLREAIYQRTGYRLRFTVGQLERPVTGEPMKESDWPVVTSAPNSVPEQKPAPAEEPADSGDDASAQSDEPAPTTPIATRGEPVVRQLLGGELVAEELLEQMSDHGEADV